MKSHCNSNRGTVKMRMRVYMSMLVLLIVTIPAIAQSEEVIWELPSYAGDEYFWQMDNDSELEFVSRVSGPERGFDVYNIGDDNPYYSYRNPAFCGMRAPADYDNDGNVEVVLIWQVQPYFSEGIALLDVVSNTIDSSILPEVEDNYYFCEVIQIVDIYNDGAPEICVEYFYQEIGDRITYWRRVYTFGTISAVEQASSTVNLPQLLLQPNPLNTTSEIVYTMPSAGNITLCLFDTNGRLVDKIVDDIKQTAGQHQINYTPHELIASGVYFLQLFTSDNITTKKFIVVR